MDQDRLDRLERLRNRIAPVSMADAERAKERLAKMWNKTPQEMDEILEDMHRAGMEAVRKVENMTNREKIIQIVKWQNNSFAHPLTCGNNSNHNLVPKEVGWWVFKKVILVCPECDYIQEDIPPIVLLA